MTGTISRCSTAIHNSGMSRICAPLSGTGLAEDNHRRQVVIEILQREREQVRAELKATTDHIFSQLKKSTSIQHVRDTLSSLLVCALRLLNYNQQIADLLILESADREWEKECCVPYDY